MSQYLIEQIESAPNPRGIHSCVTEVHGADRLESVSIVCDETGDEPVPRIDVRVHRAEPRTSWLGNHPQQRGSS